MSMPYGAAGCIYCVARLSHIWASYTTWYRCVMQTCKTWHEVVAWPRAPSPVWVQSSPVWPSSPGVMTDAEGVQGMLGTGHCLVALATGHTVLGSAWSDAQWAQAGAVHSVEGCLPMEGVLCALHGRYWLTLGISTVGPGPLRRFGTRVSAHITDTPMRPGFTTRA
jgi:hypothetical protein